MCGCLDILTDVPVVVGADSHGPVATAPGVNVNPAFAHVNTGEGASRQTSKGKLLGPIERRGQFHAGPGYQQAPRTSEDKRLVA